MPYPEGFLWGVATAGYQVEQSREQVDWSIFTTDPRIDDRVFRMSASFPHQIDLVPSGEAVHHHRLDAVRADLDRVVSLGLGAYRFSFEWSRLQTAEQNQAGELNAGWRDHYLAVLDEILARRLEPIITLNHFALPDWVLVPPAGESWMFLPVAAEDDRYNRSLRGWETVATVDAFVRYVEQMFRAVVGAHRGRGFQWLTVNEPVGSATLGYVAGIWPPGFVASDHRARLALLNLASAHVRATVRLRHLAAELGEPAGAHQIGFAHAMMATTRAALSSAATLAVEGLVGGAAVFGGGFAIAGAVIGAILAILAAIASVLTCGLALALVVGAMVLGAVIGAAGGAIVGGVVGVILGAIGGLATDVHERARRQFDYLVNDWFLEAVVNGRLDRRVDADATPLDWSVAGDRPALIDSLGLPPDTTDFPRPDFVGVNYYRRVHVFYDWKTAQVTRLGASRIDDDLSTTSEPHGLLTDLGHEIFPQGLWNLLQRLESRYRVPVLVSENGMSEGVDANRAAYLVAHADRLHAAANDPLAAGEVRPRLKGYVLWTLQDNFEWHHNYRPAARFGAFSIGNRADEDNTFLSGDTTTFKRRLTEGAVALRALARGGDPAAARRRFGSIDPDGQSILLPEATNGALFHLGAPLAGCRLFLDGGPDPATRDGLLYHPSANQWIPLRGFAAAGEWLTFAHDGLTGAGIAAQGFRVRPAADGSIAGEVFPPGIPVPFFAAPFTGTPAPMYGLWVVDAPRLTRAFLFHDFDDDRGIYGKRLPNQSGAKWIPFFVRRATDGRLVTTVAGRTVDFQGGEAGTELTATWSPLVTAGSSTTETFRRLASTFTF